MRMEEYMNANAKFTALANLKEGWWGPGSKAVEPDALDAVEQLLPLLEEEQIAFASNGDGAVVLEWVTNKILRDGRHVRTFYTGVIENSTTIYAIRDAEILHGEEMSEELDETPLANVNELRQFIIDSL